MVKNPPAKAGDARDTGSIPGLDRSPVGGNGNQLQYSCLEDPTDREAWWAIVHRVTKSRVRLKRLNTHTHMGKEQLSLFIKPRVSGLFITNKGEFSQEYRQRKGQPNSAGLV